MAGIEELTQSYKGGEFMLDALQHATAMTHMIFDGERELPDEEDAFEAGRKRAQENPHRVQNPAGDDSEIGKFDISKSVEDKRQVFGWAYITHDKDGRLIVDKSGESIPNPEELENAAYHYVLKSRTQGDMHRRSLADVAHDAGTMIESVVFTPEKIEKMGLPAGSMPIGWWVGFHVTDDATWQEIKKGNRKSFSIHGKGRKAKAS